MKLTKRGNKKRPKDGVRPHWTFVKYDCAACSECGGDIDTGFETTSEAKENWHELYPYCPFCGAKMDGGEDNG